MKGTKDMSKIDMYARNLDNCQTYLHFEHRVIRRVNLEGLAVFTKVKVLARRV